ncbi:MAG: tannase and feruloyl esterase [Caulobacteraceae bacterium]|nr:tannase and feruloyl esterase [Caulobacteraceae bacterium]
MMPRRLSPLRLALLLLAPLALPAAAHAAVDAAGCAALAEAKVAASAIGLPTRGAAATGASLTEDPVNGRFCKVLGVIRPVDPAAPDIRFQVNLPADWNRKALQIGGGGYDGVLVNAEAARFPAPNKPSPLRQGYATFGSDSGHVTPPGEDAAAFAANAEALQNFAGDQLKKTHDVALALIRRAYGAAPRRTYFQGNSQGGHEGFIVVQRWPQDYDGVVAIHPVYDFVALQTDGVLVGQAVYNRPGAWLSPDKVALVSGKVLAACDALDGLKDGLIGNVRACDKAFDPAALRCANGADTGPDCLSDAQVQALRTLGAPMPLRVRLAGGVDRFGQWPVLEGASMGARFTPFGRTAAKPRPPGANDSFLHMMGDQMVRHMVVRDVAYDTLAFDPAAHAAQLQALSRRMDASDPDISAFQKRGGKLLLMHGTVDMAVTPYNTIAYYEQLKGRFGEAGLHRFVRFYVAPGFGHGDGAFQVGWDSLGALDAWVDRGVDPGPQVAVDTAKATAGRGRPLCEYPAYPRYAGAGDPNAASSFTCAMP